MRNNTDPGTFWMKYHFYWKISNDVRFDDELAVKGRRQSLAFLLSDLIFDVFCRQEWTHIWNMGQDKTLLPVAAPFVYEVRTLLIFE